MAQKRYYDFQSKIKSKNSAEAIAMASAGIGVKYGFNKVSVSGNSFIISSDNPITLTNSETGALDEVKHVVITPDGIITAETGDISLALSDSQSLVSNAYYFVLASHQHIESLDTIIATSYILIKASNDISSLLGVDKTINDWYEELVKSYSTFNKNTTVIAAIIDYKSNDNIKAYVPLNNSWPSKIDAEVANLNSIISGIKGKLPIVIRPKEIKEEADDNKYVKVYLNDEDSKNIEENDIIMIGLPLSYSGGGNRWLNCSFPAKADEDISVLNTNYDIGGDKLVGVGYDPVNKVINIIDRSSSSLFQVGTVGLKYSYVIIFKP